MGDSVWPGVEIPIRHTFHANMIYAILGVDVLLVILSKQLGLDGF